MKNFSFGKLCLLGIVVINLSNVRTANAQMKFMNTGIILPTFNPQPVNNYIYNDVDGNPFLFDDWQAADLETSDGTKYENVKIKYDILTDKVLAEKASDYSLIYFKSLNSLNFISSDGKRFKSGYPSVKNYDLNTLYQVLVEGKTTLLKKLSKELVVSKPYSSAVVEKKIVDNNTYYLYIDNKMVLLKKSDDNILSLLSNNTIAMKTYFKTHKPNLKQDADLQKVITYYNSL
ncbi:hypothetical protein [Mucilaginibacter terrae]|uniref:Uncharacterized protein n=1 Tax=Mucilaginibacter terrae TaxID=1955052 RepID=A0ABU3GY75_9SPHI|nr:hypothetical protein [Mucilaginibacter terrae]MDT3404731.1 hypothetical protein [Mucilaginibacter terrae]